MPWCFDWRRDFAALLSLVGTVFAPLPTVVFAGSLTGTSVTLEATAAESEQESHPLTDAVDDTPRNQAGTAAEAEPPTGQAKSSEFVANNESHAEATIDAEILADESTEPSPSDQPSWWQSLIDPQRIASTAQLAATMTALGLLPAFVMLTTSYVRISVVLAVLRQALGVQQLLPTQVSMSLAVFCTALVMWPTWTVVHHQVVEPWQSGGPPADWALVSQQAMQPVREFMVHQIDTHKNWDDIHLFMKYAAEGSPYPATFDDVPLRVLFPAYLLSELKTAFLIGFQIYLPFLVIDLVIAAVTTSMGMFMLAPTTIALPLKLLLFVIVDGWRLVIDMLLQSFK